MSGMAARGLYSVLSAYTMSVQQLHGKYAMKEEEKIEVAACVNVPQIHSHVLEWPLLNTTASVTRGLESVA